MVRILMIILLGLMLAHAPLYSAENYAADKVRLSDPTRPLVNTRIKASSGNTVAPTVKTEQAALSLQAIFYDQAQKKAVIDGKLVTGGENVSGYRVDRIEARRVVLVRGGQRKVLRLAPSVKVLKK